LEADEGRLEKTAHAEGSDEGKYFFGSAVKINKISVKMNLKHRVIKNEIRT